MKIVIPQKPAIASSMGATPQGFFPALDSTKQVAQAHGNEVVALTPEMVAGVCDLTAFNAAYREQANSPNPPWFEEWCFEQWFMIRAWMDQHQERLIFKSEADALIFFNVNEFWSELPHRPQFGTWPSQSCVVTREGVEAICSCFLNTMLSRTAHAFKGGDPISDWTMIKGLMKSMPGRFLDMTGETVDRDAVIDDDLLNLTDEARYKRLKDIWFLGGTPWWFMAKRKTRRMLTIHCRIAKRDVPLVVGQWRRSLAGERTRLYLPAHDDACQD